MFLWWPFTKIVEAVMIHQKIWPGGEGLGKGVGRGWVRGWGGGLWCGLGGGGGTYFPCMSRNKILKIFLSESTGPISIKFGRNVSLVTLWQDCSSHHYLSKNMGVRGWGLLAHLSTKSAWWAIVFGQYLSSFVPRASYSVNNFKSLLLLHPWTNWLETWKEVSGWLVDKKNGGHGCYLENLFFDSSEPKGHLTWNLAGGSWVSFRAKIVKIGRIRIQDGHYGLHLENLFFTSSPETKGQLTWNLVGSIAVTCR